MPPASSERPPVVVLTGPTAAGKSALALRLAERFEGEIVNADSMQVYRYLDIGTAKPSAADRARVPHHLLDVVLPDVPYSAGRYTGEARAAAARVHARGHPVFLTGGTGLYIRAFLEGLLPGGGADPELRERLEAEHAAASRQGDPERLHRRLATLDPEAAARIHPHDLRRLVRALELLERSGRPASTQRSAHAFADRPYRVLHLALDPGVEELDRRIDRRCAAMIEAGLLREVRELRQRGYGPELRSMQAIGYRHMQPVVDGLDTLVNALAAMQRDTRRFARRQRTWLRGVPEARWLHPDDEDGVTKAVEELLRR
jgi:tRNA dimethylallyltransferase